ncbi:MAG TPA: Crp/Fnr family transcriptional regulator [Candidatus Angelobacter sp.]|nr:Crp/Fnr family transcriptional regulator [Candidatus Angelobacter sp.]
MSLGSIRKEKKTPVPLDTKPDQTAPRKAILPPIDGGTFLSLPGKGKTVIPLAKGQILFSQGELGDNIFYIRKGRIKFSVVSKGGREATIALLGPGDFVGHECIAARSLLRLTTASAVSDSEVLRIEKHEMIRALHEDHGFSEFFNRFVLERSISIQADLVDQLFNSSEKRLARMLLLLAQYGEENKPGTVVPKISQETLATMIGTTRSRVNYFMNRFRKLGFIHYDGQLRVNSSLLSVVLRD